jgi:hypothetical protein
MNEMKKPYCCEIHCTKDAEFNVQDVGQNATYEDYTHCCSKHLDEMIGDGRYEVTRLIHE